jgi:hypothetical protein
METAGRRLNSTWNYGDTVLHEVEGPCLCADIAVALKKAEVMTIGDFLSASYLYASQETISE